MTVSANPILFSVPYELKARFLCSLSVNKSGGFGSSSHNCTNLD